MTVKFGDKSRDYLILKKLYVHQSKEQIAYNNIILTRGTKQRKKMTDQ